MLSDIFLISAGVHTPGRRLYSWRFLMAVATLALGLVIFALFYGLVAACDRL